MRDRRHRSRELRNFRFMRENGRRRQAKFGLGIRERSEV
jgi:hypothetical protein